MQTFWAAPHMPTKAGLKAVDMFRAVHDGRIRFLWVMATNPAVSMPDAGFVREALARCETVVVSGAYLLQSELVFKKGADPMAGHKM